jgi:aspartyl-tRNA(Asn)/glutamyl-tRNA(Gln) amidotransferase subunit A
VFTIGANLAGIPGLSVPMGLSASGLPVAVQLLGPADSEPRILQAARALEADGRTDLMPSTYEREFAWPGK